MAGLTDDQMDQAAQQPPQGLSDDQMDQAAQQPQQEQGLSDDHMDQSQAQPQDNQRTWGQEIGRDVRTAARAVLPTAAGAVGIGIGAAAGAPAGPIGVVGGALAGGAAAGFAADAIQNKLLDAMGWDSEASRQADAANPNVGSLAAGVAPMAASFNVGGLGVKLADRLVNAGAMGMIDIGQQALTKGPSNIDPTEALVSAGAGAVLGAPRAGIQGAVGAALGRDGAALGRSPPTVEETASPVSMPAAASTAQGLEAPAEAAQPTVMNKPGDLANKGQGAQSVTGEEPGGLKDAVPEAEEAVSDTPSTPLVVGVGGPLDDPALGVALGVGDQSGIMRGESPEPSQPPETPQVQPPAANPDETIGVGDQRGYAGGTPDDMPPTEPGRPAAAQAAIDARPSAQGQRTFPTELISLPKATQAAIKGQPPEVYPDKTGVGSFTPPRPEGSEIPPTRTAQREQQIKDIFPGEAPPPDTTGLETPVENSAEKAEIPAQDMAGLETPSKTIPDDLSIPDFLKRSKTQSLSATATDEDNLSFASAGEGQPPTDRLIMARQRGSDFFDNNPDYPIKELSEASQDRVSSLPERDAFVAGFKEAAKRPQSLSGAATENPTFAAAEQAKQKSQIGSALSQLPGVHAFRTAFVPESLTESSGKFGDIVREGQGTINQSRALYDRNMKPVDEAINSTDPDARDQFSRTFQTGVPKDNPLSRIGGPALDTEKTYNARLAKVDPDGNWQTNFLPSLFADVRGAKDFVTKWQDDERHGIPTIGDFKDAGFQLRKNLLRQDGSDDPVRLMQGLYGARDKFLEGKFITNKAVDEGIVFPHDVPGTVPLEGVTKGGAPLYAEPEVATMWNRYFGSNAIDPTDKSFFNTSLKLKNMTTAWQLVGGGYHMVAESTEAMNGDVMGAVSQAAAGRFAEAGKKLAGAPLAPYRQATKSATDALAAYYKGDFIGPRTMTQQAVEHLVKAGLTPERIARYTPDVNSAAHGFFSGWNVEMPQGLKGVKFDKLGASELKARFKTEPVGAALQALGKSMQTIMEPMFNTYIPRLKLGASLEQMTDYMAANSDKPHLYLQKAKEILKSTDDRLGEMNQSTLFWNNNLKKGANMLMISPGWETGTLRAAVGGAGSFIKNPKSLSITSPDFHPNAAFPFAFAITTAVVGSIYQFLKTGKMPEDAKDPFFPRTGGTAARSSQPERAIMPGYLKDIYGMWHALTGTEGMTKNAAQMLYNKLSMVPRATWDTMANKDWAGQQIYDPSDPLHEKMRQYLSYVQQNMMPIIEQQVTKGQKGSNISKGEAAFGIRHAPGEIQDPVKTEQGVAARNKREKDTAAKFRQRMNQ